MAERNHDFARCPRRFIKTIRISATIRGVAPIAPSTLSYLSASRAMRTFLKSVSYSPDATTFCNVALRPPSPATGTRMLKVDQLSARCNGGMRVFDTRTGMHPIARYLQESSGLARRWWCGSWLDRDQYWATLHRRTPTHILTHKSKRAVPNGAAWGRTLRALDSTAPRRLPGCRTWPRGTFPTRPRSSQFVGQSEHRYRQRRSRRRSFGLK